MARRKTIKLSTPQDVRKALSRVANMVLNGELDPKQANCILYACNVTLGAIRTDDQQRRIEELEETILQKRGIY